MVQINFALKEINCKLVYYGPGRSGKTTNLEQVHKKAPEDSKGDLVSINTETDRTLYFDFLPLNLGKVAGMATKFSLYTVPGQVYYNATRKLVLQGVDGVVFVADSSPHMMDENIESLENMLENLKENGVNMDEVAIVLQYNKRDVDGAFPIEVLDEKLNSQGWPTVEACAFKGEGVFPTLKKLSGIVIAKLNESSSSGIGSSSPAPKKSAPPPKPPAPVSAPPPVALEPAVQEQQVEEAPVNVAPPPPPPVAQEPAPAPVPTPTASVEANNESVVRESKTDIIAARLAKMRSEKGGPATNHTTDKEEVEVEYRPKKLKSKGFVGFLKGLFGK
ncbi:MAG: hypothetical protein COA79_08020 [Planctomycetota bacterium]|nr:MAG: hypothetical protein COA79_08020 [Planctomycetota bacterium]